MSIGGTAAVGQPDVAHIGAFTMPNWGDQLYPGTTTALLHRSGFTGRTAHFSPLPGRTLAGESIEPLARVRGCGASVALVGGGDLIRFNPRTTAMDHLSVPTRLRGRRLNRLRAAWFSRTRLLPGPGPWSPDESWLPSGPAVLLSVGVHTVPETAAAHRAISHYHGAWVRTESGAQRLAGAGVPRDRIIVAPDMIFALAELEDQDAVRARGRDILSRHLGGSDLPVLFQAAEFHGWPRDRVRAALETLRGLPVATLSLGSYAGEDRLLSQAAAPLGVPMLHDLRADEITAVMAAAGAVFTTSMHAAIVAASFGTPALVPGVGKTRDAFAVCPEPPPLFEVEDADLSATAKSVIGTRVAHSTEANRVAATDAFTATVRMAGLG